MWWKAEMMDDSEERMELGDRTGGKQVGGQDPEGISGYKGATRANMR
jgi:hypothetical protein